jgi:hypothetical protein
MKKLLFVLFVAILALLCCAFAVSSVRADTTGTLYPTDYPIYFTMVVKINGATVGSTAATVWSATSGTVTADIAVSSPIWLNAGEQATVSFVDCAGTTMRTDVVATGAGYLNTATWTAHFNIYTSETYSYDDGVTKNIDYALYSSGTSVTGVSFTNYYYVTVNSAYGSPTGSQWVAQGSNLDVSVTTPSLVDTGIQVLCTGNSIDGVGSYASHSFTNIQSDLSITFNWQVQYQVTFSQSGLDSSATGTVFTYNGSPVTYAFMPYNVWVNSGASVSFTFSSTVSSSTSGTRFVLYSSVSSPVTINGPVTISSTFITQYYVTVSTAYSYGLGEGWYTVGSTAQISLGSSTVSGGVGTQSAFASWSGSGSGSYTGSSLSPSFAVNGPITETAVWTTQYYLTVYGVYATSSGSGWYNSGATASFSTDASVPGGTGVQVGFGSWVGSGSGSYTGSTRSATCTMNAPITETANWNTQYYLTVNSAYGTTTGSGWYDSGATAYAGLTSDTATVGGSRYIFVSWSAGGSNYSQSSPITMAAPYIVSATWSTQYYLTVTSPYATPSGSGWFNAGATAYASVNTNIVIDGDGTHTLQGWGGGATGSGLTSNAIIMSSAKNAIASWSTTGAPAGANVSYTVNLSGPFYEDGTAASGDAISCLLTYANQTIYQFTMTSGVGSPENLTIHSTTPFVQLSWNASSLSNFTRVYKFISGTTNTTEHLFIINPNQPSNIYTFSITDFYGMEHPYLQTRISPDGTTYYTVEQAYLDDGGGSVSFVMTQYQMYLLTFVCDQGTYTKTFTASTLGTPGQYPVSLNILSGDFPQSNSSTQFTVTVDRTNGTIISVTYIDPTLNTTWVSMQISHIINGGTVIDYFANTTGNTQLFDWSQADASISYLITVQSFSGTSNIWNLVSEAPYTTSNPFLGLLDFLGVNVNTLPQVQTGWPMNMTSAQIAQTIAMIIIMLFLCIGSFRNAGASCLMAWIAGGIMLYLGWWGGGNVLTSIPEFALAGFLSIFIIIDESKPTIREV